MIESCRLYELSANQENEQAKDNIQEKDDHLKRIQF